MNRTGEQTKSSRLEHIQEPKKRVPTTLTPVPGPSRPQSKLKLNSSNDPPSSLSLPRFHATADRNARRPPFQTAQARPVPGSRGVPPPHSPFLPSAAVRKRRELRAAAGPALPRGLVQSPPAAQAPRPPRASRAGVSRDAAAERAQSAAGAFAAQNGGGRGCGGGGGASEPSPGSPGPGEPGP